MTSRMLSRTSPLVFLLVLFLATSTAHSQVDSSSGLVLSRAARHWEFMPAVGEKAALLGRESGTVEAWVYPLKLFRDFSLVFHVGDRDLPAASLVRTIEVRPEAVTLLYAGDTFFVRETFFVPRGEMGAVIALDVTTFQPVDIEARFHRDFQFMWPAGMGGTYGSWDEKQRAFAFGEEQKKWFGLVGSPSAVDPKSDFDTNYFSEPRDSFRLGTIREGTERKLIVIAGSVTTREDVEATYRRLSNQYEQLRTAAAAEYTRYLGETTSLSLPDADLQRAFDWSRVSLLQGVVSNPYLGTGLVAGYRTSGSSGRPGFAWFFGRDSEWSSFALNSIGDFRTTHTALDFLSKYQRQDGKIPHEISQAAQQTDWFTNFPYPWASADATPLYIISVADYYLHSGDAEFVNDHWDNIARAYQFLRSTWDKNGIPQNSGIGHGWVEGGPLLPVKSEFYQSGLGAEALRAMATLALVAHKNDIATEADRLFSQRQSQLNELFWNPQGRYFSFALDQHDRRVDTPTVLTTVPMWFDLTDQQKTDATITQLADSDHASDWGMRIISDRDPRYDPSGYHFGSVWPLFTGWASVAEYRYHRPLPAYENLRANALLALNGSAGHTTEVLSGSFFEQLSTSSPHQIWSAAMVVSPIMRGLLGIGASIDEKRLTVAPHVPGDWTFWKAHNVHLGSSTVDLTYSRDTNSVTLTAQCANANGAMLRFSPSFSLRAKIIGVEVNGRPAKFAVQASLTDQHVPVDTPMTANTMIRIRVANDFALVLNQGLPELGQPSRNLKIVNETWTSSRDAVTYDVEGLSGKTYELAYSGEVANAEGAELTADRHRLKMTLPPGEQGYRHARFTIHFASK